jgi:hypothetical protein
MAAVLSWQRQRALVVHHLLCPLFRKVTLISYDIVTYIIFFAHFGVAHII